MPNNSSEIKAKGATFVRFYPSDWRSGCIGLTCEQEGFYWRVCAHYYETGVRLPLDDDDARARLGSMDRRAYRRLKNDLVSKGLMHEERDGYAIPRCEEELRLALARTTSRDAQAGVDSARNHAGKEPDHGRVADEPKGEVAPKSAASPTEVEPKSGQSRPDFAEKSEEILRANKEPIANNQKNPPTPTIDWRTAFASADETHGVIVTEAGSIQLVNGTRQFWLDEFGGDAKRLDLALRQIAVQPNSRHTAKAQVERQLARMASDKLDRDQRYTAAAAANAAGKTAGKPFKPSRW